MRKIPNRSGHITLALAILLLGAALQRAQSAEAVFLSANNEMHLAWFDNNTVVKGDSTNHFSRRSAPNTNRPGVPYAFGIQAFQGKPMRIGDLVSISSNDTMHFAWFIQRVPKGDPEFFLWVCAGPSNAIGVTRDWYRSRLPSGASPSDLLFITSNNDMHFAWFKRGNELWVGRGSSDNLGKHDVKRSPLPSGVRVSDILFMASNDDMHFAFLKNGTYIAGASDNLDSMRRGVRYDLSRLRGR